MAASEALARAVLGAADLGAGLALSDAAGWNQTADDWRVFVQSGYVPGRRNGNGELVATAAALPYDDAQGWISMVLVRAGWRHQGIATELMNDCIDRLRAAALVPVLDATPAGEPVYRRLGFEPGLAFERWQADARQIAGAAVTRTNVAAFRRADAHDLDAILALDHSANRVARRFLFEAFLRRADTRAWIGHERDAFVLVRGGRRATQVGPLVAPNPKTAIALLAVALGGLRGAVFLDVANRQPELIDWLKSNGFVHQRPFVRMALGDAPALHGSERQYLFAGPEFG